MSGFHVGQLVAYVRKPGPIGGYGDEVHPKYGSIYTVRDICHDGRGAYLLVHEIQNPIRWYQEGKLEPGFRDHHFRPVDESRLEVFRAALAPTPRKRVDA